MVGNSIILSIGLSSTFISNAILRAEGKQLNNLQLLIFTKFRQADIICVGNLASDHSWAIQTSDHSWAIQNNQLLIIQGLFTQFGALFCLLFLPTASFSFIPYLLAHLPVQEPGKKPLINSNSQYKHFQQLKLVKE